MAPRTPESSSSQATVHAFDADTGGGSVIGDDGHVLGFTADAWSAGPLRTLRVGQRVRITVAEGTVATLTLATFSAP